ncbi:hypothetical protein HPSA20_0350 [Helicobacter pylori SouthAfrica20]|uniref:Uncharacterized protein n=1 Tax=Helicobacter pylori SouthAfrica20 TaxID=1352356 RepID=T1U885_HELPX|nr:hypothetical protein HPSA20_0350 [Helicobacter pylori SouthAfrica20]
MDISYPKKTRDILQLKYSPNGYVLASSRPKVQSFSCG